MRSGHSNPQNRACGLKVEVVPYYGKMHQTPIRLRISEARLYDSGAPCSY